MDYGFGGEDSFLDSYMEDRLSGNFGSYDGGYSDYGSFGSYRDYGVAVVERDDDYDYPDDSEDEDEEYERLREEY